MKATARLQLWAPPTRNYMLRRPDFRVSSRPTVSKPLFSYRFIPDLNRRYASTTVGDSGGDSGSLVARLKNVFWGATIILSGVAVYFYITDTRAGIHRWVVVPGLRYLYPDAEDAHRVANQALKMLYQFGLYPRERGNPDTQAELQVEVFGRELQNPIATSAGIDKHADIPDPLFDMGASIIEIGGCTPLPQSGNPTPRVFRLPSQNAIINRYGLNSEGADYIAMKLRHRVRGFAKDLGFGVDEKAEERVLNGEAGVPPGSLKPGKLMAVQVAKNKFTPDHDLDAVTADYVYCVNAVGKYADIIVVNVSSPNTPGLRGLQAFAPLTSILTGVVKAAKSIDRNTKPAVMVKVSPDEDSDEDIMGISEAVWESGIDGVIVGNTTKRRPAATPTGYRMPPEEEQVLLEQGGFSGPHLFQQTLNLVKRYREPLSVRPPPKVQPTATSQESDIPSTAPPIPISGDASEPADQAVNSPSHDLSPETTSSTTNFTTAEESKTADKPKIIFATGGITSGKQAQEILDAGASVAMVYTALIYGGVGTVGRIKEEMREERKKRKYEDSRIDD